MIGQPSFFSEGPPQFFFIIALKNNFFSDCRPEKKSALSESEIFFVFLGCRLNGRRYILKSAIKNSVVLRNWAREAVFGYISLDMESLPP